MGFNLAGLIVRKKLTEIEIGTFLETSLHFLEEVDFETATSDFRDENTIDVLQTEKGTLIITGFGNIYDLASIKEEVIQFMVSDISDTYYFEQYSDGNLLRKYITSQGETAEDIGEGIISEEDDIMDKVWTLTDEYLQNGFVENMFDMKFKRYETK